MKPKALYISLFIILIVSQACNTLYNYKTINIEILEPAEVKLPQNYPNLAIKYNNINAAWNPNFAKYFKNDKILTDSTNLDSLASFEYFRRFNEVLKNQNYFNKISEVKASDYSNTIFTDSININLHFEATDSSLKVNAAKIAILEQKDILKSIPPNNTNKKVTRFIDPDFGFYTEKEISEIRDSTGADLLLSLDFFYTLNGRNMQNLLGLTSEIVFVNYFWTAYNLQNKSPEFTIIKRDTIFWEKFNDPYADGLRRLPNRKDAVMNAAYIAGTNTAQYLIPHWIDVERLYYKSRHVDLKPIDNLIKNGNWIEAAKLWKKQIDNPNKNIAAKCMYNMALACEMNDELEAAIEWVVKSYHVFGEKNEIHALNCKEYIRVLGQRKQDKNIIDLQYSSAN